MNRIYTNAWLKLEPGRCRYGLMLKEDGFIMDDGVVARLAPDRFHVTTTTGGAPRVLAHMEDYLQTEWPDLEVWLTSTTEQWAVIAVQGPKAREVIAPLVSGIDLSPEAFPHMACARASSAACRAGSSACASPANSASRSTCRPITAAPSGRRSSSAGKPFGITPYGTETMHVLRAEKGYIIVGQETDGTVTPDDLGLAGHDRQDEARLRRQALARAAGHASRPTASSSSASSRTTRGSCSTRARRSSRDPDQPLPMRMLGHVTSSYWSPTCERSIALALVAGGRGRIGERLYVTMPKGFATVKVVEPVFFDAKGERVHA